MLPMIVIKSQILELAEFGRQFLYKIVMIKMWCVPQVCDLHLIGHLKQKNNFHLYKVCLYSNNPPFHRALFKEPCICKIFFIFFAFWCVWIQFSIKIICIFVSEIFWLALNCGSIYLTLNNHTALCITFLSKIISRLGYMLRSMWSLKYLLMI